MRDILLEYKIPQEITFNSVIIPDFCRFYKEHHFAEGEKLYNEANFRDAYEYFRKKVGTSIDNVEVFANKAHALTAIEKPDMAIFDYNRAIEIAGSYHCFFHYVGSSLAHNICVIYSLLGNFEESIRFKARASFLYKLNLYKNDELADPSADLLPRNSHSNDLSIFSNSSLKSIVEKAREAFHLHDPEGALLLYKKALEASESEHLNYHISTASIYYYRGLAFKALSKYDLAKMDFLRAMEFEKKNHKNHIIAKQIRLLGG